MGRSDLCLLQGWTSEPVLNNGRIQGQGQLGYMEREKLESFLFDDREWGRGVSKETQ